MFFSRLKVVFGILEGGVEKNGLGPRRPLEARPLVAVEGRDAEGVPAAGIGRIDDHAIEHVLTQHRGMLGLEALKKPHQTDQHDKGPKHFKRKVSLTGWNI